MNDLVSSIPQVDLMPSQLRGNHPPSAPGQPVMGLGAWAMRKRLARSYHGIKERSEWWLLGSGREGDEELFKGLKVSVK